MKKLLLFMIVLFLMFPSLVLADKKGDLADEARIELEGEINCNYKRLITKAIKEVKYAERNLEDAKCVLKKLQKKEPSDVYIFKTDYTTLTTMSNGYILTN